MKTLKRANKLKSPSSPGIGLRQNKPVARFGHLVQVVELTRADTGCSEVISC